MNNEDENEDEDEDEGEYKNAVEIEWDSPLQTTFFFSPPGIQKEMYFGLL